MVRLMFSSVRDRVVDIESYAKKMQRWGSCGLTSNVQNATTANSSVLVKEICLRPWNWLFRRRRSTSTVSGR